MFSNGFLSFFLELPRILNLNLNLFRVVMWSVSRSFFVMRDVSLFLIRSFVLLLFLLHDLWSPYVPSLTTSRLRIESRPKREGSGTRPAPYCSLVMAELFARSLARPLLDHLRDPFLEAFLMLESIYFSVNLLGRLLSLDLPPLLFWCRWWVSVWSLFEFLERVGRIWFHLSWIFVLCS